mmetsp:Transcript_126562/g.354391  ORF Transcript_126562/g.354391 Transcript_126562/m.354391 type:complete len:131 (-) Transcript_126562:99-491(-)
MEEAEAADGAQKAAEVAPSPAIPEPVAEAKADAGAALGQPGAGQGMDKVGHEGVAEVDEVALEGGDAVSMAAQEAGDTAQHQAGDTAENKAGDTAQRNAGDGEGWELAAPHDHDVGSSAPVGEHRAAPGA